MNYLQYVKYVVFCNFYSIITIKLEVYMTILDDAGYMFRINNSGYTFFLLIRHENDMIKFFFRKERSPYWIESFSASVNNNFTEMIGTPVLNWYKPEHIQRLADWFENICLNNTKWRSIDGRLHTEQRYNGMANKSARILRGYIFIKF